MRGYSFPVPTGAKYTFTIKEGADGKNGRISVNYDGFIDDVGVNDMLLVDGGMLSLKILEKTKQDVVCEVVDGGVMGSRYVFDHVVYTLQVKKKEYWVCKCRRPIRAVMPTNMLVQFRVTVRQGNTSQFLHAPFLVCLTCTCPVVSLRL